MLKLTKTGIGLLTRQYRSVLKKCWAINVGLFALSTVMLPNDANAWGLFNVEGAGQPNWGALNSGYTRYYGFYAPGGGSIALAERPGGGDYQVSMQIDGYFYQNEGRYRVLDTSDITAYYNALSSYATTASLASASVNYANSAGSVAWSSITGKPSTFTPSAHTHAISDITNLETTLNGKQATLVSGTNIKTINGESILGSGDLTISGGANYTAGTGISIENDTISLNTTYLNNNYYRKDEKSEILNGFEKGKIGNENDDNFSKFRADNDNFVTKNGGFVLNNGDFPLKNPSRFGAFAKCEKACPRPSERFPASLEKNSAFEQYSRSARGTFLFVSQTHKNVLDNFYKNSQCLKASNDNFAATTFLRAI